MMSFIWLDRLFSQVPKTESTLTTRGERLVIAKLKYLFNVVTMVSNSLYDDCQKQVHEIINIFTSKQLSTTQCLAPDLRTNSTARLKICNWYRKIFYNIITTILNSFQLKWAGFYLTVATCILFPISRGPILKTRVSHDVINIQLSHMDLIQD